MREWLRIRGNLGNLRERAQLVVSRYTAAATAAATNMLRSPHSGKADATGPV
jgi:hypothetical protein